MKARNGLIIPLLAILVGVGMIVTAAGVVTVSNIVPRHNEVTDVTSLMHIDIQASSTLPNWANGSASIGTVYNCNIFWSSTAAIHSVSVVVLFQKPSIATTDVSMTFMQLPGSVWTPVTFEPGTASDTIRGTLGSPFAVGAGESATYAIQLAYNVPGNYAAQLYVEGIPT